MKTEYLTTEEVAGLLKLSTSTVQKMAREGRLTALKVGRLWRFPPQSPTVHLYKQKQATASERISSAHGRANGLKELVKAASDLKITSSR